MKASGYWQIAVASVWCCSLGALAQTHQATLATDGAWTWYNDPRALFHQGKLYLGYVRASDGKTALDVFDLRTGVAANLWVSGFSQRDDHNVPGLCVKQDGTLLAVYARHNSDRHFAYRTSKSSTPDTPAGWNEERTIPDSTAGMTYANPFQLSGEGGRIYNFCRNLNFNPTVYTSVDGGASWSPPQPFITTGKGGVRPYVKYSSDGKGRIDFLYTDGHPRDVKNSLYHMYYEKGSFHRTDGTPIRNYADLPILHDRGERGSVIYQYSEADQPDANEWIPNGRAWCWETAVDIDGHPVAVFTVRLAGVTGANWHDRRIYYYYARWTGQTWQKRFIAHAGRPLYNREGDYAGGVCIDPQNPNVVYVSSNAAAPFDLAPSNTALNANQRYELWKGTTADGGLTFAWTPVTTDSGKDNLRPYVPRRNGGEPCVLWFQGVYNTFTSYDCSVVGLFTTDVPKPPPTPKIVYVDATWGTGGNTTLANGKPVEPTSSASGTDGVWRSRAFGRACTVLEAGGASAPEEPGNAEDCPRLVTTIPGLTPDAQYSIYAYFWSAASQNWRIRAGVSDAKGDLPLFARTTSRMATAAGFAVPALLTEGDRVLYQAPLGIIKADGKGRIRVFVDDDPASRRTGNGWANRTWYDGVGYRQEQRP